jgi:hypothetical protein
MVGPALKSSLRPTHVPLHRRRHRTSREPKRQAFYKKAEELFCLWNVLSDLIGPPPNSVCRPFP